MRDISSDNQISIFEYLEEIHKKIKPCECGNDRLAVRYTGCGIPLQFVPIPVYDQYLYTVFCPNCFRVAMGGPNEDAWRSNKLTIERAVRDWNEFPHRDDSDKRLGMFGLEHYAEIMPQTIERFPEIREIMGI